MAGGGDTLNAGAVIAGFSCPVADVFEGISRNLSGTH